MGEATTLHKEDRAGLIVAVALHVGVVALLLFQPAPPPFPEREERMTVSLASEVSLEATSPNPAPEARAAIAPTLSDQSVEPVEELPEPAEPVEIAAPPPPAPPAPTRRTASTQPPAPDRDRSRPDKPTPTPTPATTPKKAEGSRIGDDFLSGKGSSTDTDETEAPAPTFGRRERAALSSAITRQLRRHWTAPAGADAELLRSEVRWSLNPDGSLRGRPRCTNIPSSVTASNRPQAALHCERAIRAVQLAAPFNLPEPFYNRWKDLVWEFNRRL